MNPLRPLLCLALLASSGLARAAARDNGDWLTDCAGHQPDLSYPVAYVLTWQVLGFGLLSTMDYDDTGFESASFRNFADGFREGPHWDDDDWQWNYLAHPVWGSETYLRARSQGFRPLGCLAFSATASLLWEFFLESWSQRPSIQDLIVTPLAGMLLGELRFRLKRRLLEHDDFAAACLLVLVDPFQTLTEWIGRACGQDWREPAYLRADTTSAKGGLRHVPVSIDLGQVDNHSSLMLRWQWSF